MSKILLKKTLLYYASLGILFLPKLALAQGLPCKPGDAFGGICLPERPGGGQAPSFDSASELVSYFVSLALMLVGLISVLFVVVGGYKYVTAGGDEEKVKKAKSTIFNALIGMAVVLLSLAIIRIVANLTGGQI